MKHAVNSLFFVLFFASASIAQIDKVENQDLLALESKLPVSASKLQKSHGVYIDVAGAGLGKYKVQYEHYLLPYMNIVTSLEVTHKAFSPHRRYARDLLRSTYGTADFSLMPGVGARFYLGNYYAQPTINLGYANFDYRGKLGVRHAFALKPELSIGRKWDLVKGVTFDFGLSVGSLIHLPKKSARSYFPVGGATIALGYEW